MKRWKTLYEQIEHFKTGYIEFQVIGMALAPSNSVVQFTREENHYGDIIYTYQW